MSTGENIVFAARDTVRLCGTLFMPASPMALVVVCSAIGVRQEFYRSFAEWLATRDFGVLTFDYRGIGASLNGRSVRHSTASKQDWGAYDMPAAVDYLAGTARGLPVYLVGHSAGGQLLGLMPNYRRLSKVVTVASSSGYLRNLAPGMRPFGAFMLKAFIPVSAKLLGYVPARWVGWGEDLPPRVALEWAAWCTKPGYVLNALGAEITEHYYDELDTPILWLTATDDPIATPENVEDMVRLLEKAPITKQRLDPNDFGLEKIGHVDFFRQRNASLWPIVTDWLSQPG